MPGVLKRASTKVSASLLYNNLSCNGKSVAYVHHSEVILVPDNAVTSGANATAVRIMDRDQAVIKQARFVEAGGAEYLVIGSTRSLQVYSPDGKRMLHSQNILDAGTADAPAFFRGLAGCTAGGEDYLVAGTSTGDVCLVACTGGAFGMPLQLREQTAPIVDLAAAFSPESADEAFVASADEAGLLVVLALGGGGASRVHASFGGDPAALCTAVRIRRNLLLSGYCTGHVRVHDLTSRSLMVQRRGQGGLLGRGTLGPHGRLRLRSKARGCSTHSEGGAWRLRPPQEAMAIQPHTPPKLTISPRLPILPIQVQIAAHARWVNALEVHPSRDVMATAAEDCTVSVWRLPSGDGSSQLKHAGALVVQDAMLCGVGFCGGGGGRDHVATVAYDVELIHSFSID